MTTIGRAWTTLASRENTPLSGPASRRRGMSRFEPSAHSAGMRVRSTTMATRTIETPAAPIARMIAASNSSRPLRAIATVSPENITVRPAVATVRAVAAMRSSRVKVCRRRSVSASAIRPSSSR
jgi:hypothetical protein